MSELQQQTEEIEVNPNKFAESFMQFAWEDGERLEEIGEQTLDEITKLLGQMKL